MSTEPPTVVVPKTKRNRRRWKVGLLIAAACCASGIVWSAMLKIQEASDRMH